MFFAGFGSSHLCNVLNLRFNEIEYKMAYDMQ